MKISNFLKKVLTLGIASSMFFSTFPNVIMAAPPSPKNVKKNDGNKEKKGKDEKKTKKDKDESSSLSSDDLSDSTVSNSSDESVESGDSDESMEPDSLGINDNYDGKFLKGFHKHRNEDRKTFADMSVVHGKPKIIDPSAVGTEIVPPVFYSDAAIGRPLIEYPGEVSHKLAKSGVKICYKLVGLDIDWLSNKETLGLLNDILGHIDDDIFYDKSHKKPSETLLYTVVDWTTDPSMIKADRQGHYLVLWYVFGGNRYDDIPGKNDSEVPTFAKKISTFDEKSSSKGSKLGSESKRGPG